MSIVPDPQSNSHLSYLCSSLSSICCKLQLSWSTVCVVVWPRHGQPVSRPRSPMTRSSSVMLRRIRRHKSDKLSSVKIPDRSSSAVSTATVAAAAAAAGMTRDEESIRVVDKKLLIHVPRRRVAHASSSTWWPIISAERFYRICICHAAHWAGGDCLQGKSEDHQNRSLLCCLLQLSSHKQTGSSIRANELVLLVTGFKFTLSFLGFFLKLSLFILVVISFCVCSLAFCAFSCQYQCNELPGQALLLTTCQVRTVQHIANMSLRWRCEVISSFVIFAVLVLQLCCCRPYKML